MTVWQNHKNCYSSIMKKKVSKMKSKAMFKCFNIFTLNNLSRQCIPQVNTPQTKEAFLNLYLDFRMNNFETMTSYATQQGTRKEIISRNWQVIMKNFPIFNNMYSFWVISPWLSTSSRFLGNGSDPTPPSY